MCVAIPGRIVTVEECDGTRLATVEWSGRDMEVSLALVPDADVGDWVLAHSGLAVRRLSAEQAERTLRMWEVRDPSG